MSDVRQLRKERPEKVAERNARAAMGGLIVAMLRRQPTISKSGADVMVAFDTGAEAERFLDLLLEAAEI